MSNQPSSNSDSPQKEKGHQQLSDNSQASSKSWSHVAVDANFFILAFAQNPSDLIHFKKIADRVSVKLYTSPQVLKELRGNLRRQVTKNIEIIDVSNKELQLYIEKARDRIDRIPQAPDLSLLIVLKKLGEQRLVSSDFYLLHSLRSLEPEIEGLMGSAFLLHILELGHDEVEDELFLEEVRERVLHTEIKYSLTRSSMYDPTTRIKLIESQAFHVVRSLRGPRIDEEDLIGMSAQEALGLLTYLQELHRRYSTFVHMIHAQNYREALTDIIASKDELYNHLVLLSWDLAAAAHRKLLRQIAPDLVLLHYLAALCHLYLGEPSDLQKTRQEIEECNQILLTVRPPTKTYRRLMIMTHLLRITINLILEDFNAATMYFSLFQRKTKEWEFTKEEATAQALYLALLVIRGEITSTEFPRITDSEEVIRFLVDLSSLYFALRKFNEAWQLLRQVLYIIQYFDLPDVLQPILQRMLLVYYAQECQSLKEFSAIAKKLQKWLKSQNHNQDVVIELIRELKSPVEVPSSYFTEASLPADKLNSAFLDWMTVIDRVDTVLLEGSILICRSWKLDWNVALLIKGFLIEERAKGGEQVKLGKGKFKVTPPPATLKERYRIHALIHADPTKKSRIYVRGGQGFRLLQLGSLLSDHI